MEKREKIKMGEGGYLNQNCWLIKALNYTPYKRCQYCELKFRSCQFLHYQIISLLLILFFPIFSFSLVVKEKISASELVIISVFTSVIVFGYFFNKSTNRIIQANFEEGKAKSALADLNEKLEEKVDEQTKELRQTYEKLKVLDNAKSEFISIASHQLRTPLTAIKGYILLLLEGTYGKFNRKAEEPIKNIYENNERLIKLVNDLLDVSRIEAGKMELEFQETSLEEIISTVVEIFKAEAQKRGIYLKWEKSEFAAPKIRVDRDKIRQVILNIIDNGIRYTKKGGVTIKCRTLNANKYQIIISDTGQGMSKEEIDNLFQSFSRGKAARGMHIEGAGLGLYIAKKFIVMHEGRIWAESPGKNKGSTFYIELPIL